MAKAKKKKKKKSGGGVSVTVRNSPTRSNKKRPKTRKKNPKHPHRRRRRNPDGGKFMSRLGAVAAVGAVALVSGVLVTIGQGKVSPGSWWSLYGIPAAALAGGAMIAGKHPKLGMGLAIGGVAPFVLPVASRAMSGGTTGPAMAAVEMGDEFFAALEGVTEIGAVEMGGGRRRMGVGAVEMGDAVEEAIDLEERGADEYEDEEYYDEPDDAYG
jgi:hypothetical protein